MTSALATTPAETPARPMNRRHRAFVRAVASGMTQTEAYRRYARPKNSTSNPESIRQVACHLARRLAQAIHAERARVAAAADHASIASKLEVAQFMTRRLRTPASNLDEHDPLVEEVTETTSPDGITRRTVKAGKKIDAANWLSKTLGWESPTQVNHTHVLADSPALRALETAATRSAARNQSDASQAVYEAELVPQDDNGHLTEQSQPHLNLSRLMLDKREQGNNSYGISRQSEEQEQGQGQDEECIQSTALDAAPPDPPPTLWDDPQADLGQHQGTE